LSVGKALLTIVNCRIYIEKASVELQERFGIVEGGEVNPTIALYLLNKKMADIVDDNGRIVDISKLIECFDKPIYSTLFFVVQDLIKRGKKIAFGETDNELIITSENTLVYVMDEDSTIKAIDLYNIVDRAIKQGYRFLIAVVDMHGDVTYYEVSKMIFPKIERREMYNERAL